MADFEEAHAPGGPPVEPRQTRKAAAERAPPTPRQKKTRTTELEALVRGSAPCRTPGTRDCTRFRNEHARSSRPWQVPETLPFHLHCCLALLQGDTGQPALTRRDAGAQEVCYGETQDEREQVKEPGVQSL